MIPGKLSWCFLEASPASKVDTLYLLRYSDDEPHPAAKQSKKHTRSSFITLSVEYYNQQGSTRCVLFQKKCENFLKSLERHNLENKTELLGARYGMIWVYYG